MTKKSPDDQKRDEVLLRMLKTPPQPHKPKADDKVNLRPPATKAEQAAFKRKDKGVSKPMKLKR